ncbi:MAG TPA: NAD(P)(+) transhydrogenase (Re/Si-specific) subunit beta, partial [Nocardioidaceae bacterium]
SALDAVVRLIYLAGATCFVLGLHLMNHPARARRGNQLSAAGMVAAVVATVVLVVDSGTVTTTGWITLGAGLAVGGFAGLFSARTVRMTAMPQLVSLFNAVGGGAAALVAVHDFLRFAEHDGSAIPAEVAVPIVLDVLIGALTFTGSLIASGKLQGVVPGQPLVFPGSRVLTAALAGVALGTGGYLATGSANPAVLVVAALAALALGVTMVLPIGGADMPVVISLLNACTGTAVAMAGFVIGNTMLIVAGALVGASGAILTALMAKAMNRSLLNIIAGGFGTGDGAGATVRQIDADDAAIQLAYASKVVIVPGYGLAVAQAQHTLRELVDLLTARGAQVDYAIHPVAGRMPGHMNVLLAEAQVPYDQLKEMDDINGEFKQTDVVLVVGANDVVNPAAKTTPGAPIYGMPILNADEAQQIVFMKRSMRPGFAGIENELLFDPKTTLLFGDAKESLGKLVAAVKSL